MRRLFAAAIVAAALLSGAGCAGSDGSGGSRDGAGAAGTTSTAPTTGAAGADNTKQVCADVKKLNSESLQKFTTTFENGLREALATEDEAKAEEIGTKTVADLAAQIKDWSAKVQALAGTASNPELKKALETLATELKKLESGEGSTNDVKTAVTAADTALAKVC